MQRMRGFVQVNDYLWCELAPLANFRAEEVRAQRSGKELDITTALRYFERNPFKWEVFGQRGSHSRLSILWTWSAGGKKRHVEHADSHNLIARGPAIPKSLKQPEEDLWKQLVDIADLETRQSKCPCRYLGVMLESHEFQPDPSQWACGVKTKGHVVFE